MVAIYLRTKFHNLSFSGYSNILFDPKAKKKRKKERTKERKKVTFCHVILNLAKINSN
jgi:hypothetical protein